MTRRRKIIIAVIIVILILLAILLLLQQPQTPPQQQAQTAAPVTNTELSPSRLLNTSVSANVAPASVNSTVPATTPAPVAEESNVIRLAAAFAERYGSFSNQTSYENLLELKPLMTATFAASTDAYVQAQRAKNASTAEYFGVTTRAINTMVASFDDGGGNARLVVKGQRREISPKNPDGRVYYQDIAIEFLKQSGQWKVNTAQWQQ